MVLAKDEQVIKSWDYAHGKFGLDRTVSDANLTITNKRIISTVESKISLSVNEVPLEKVRSISGNYKKNKSLGAIIELILGIPLCLVLIGIVFVVDAVKKLRACVLTIEVKTDGFEGTSMFVGAAAAEESVKKGSIFSRLFKTKFKVHVKKDMAKEMLESLSAIVIDNK